MDIHDIADAATVAGFILAVPALIVGVIQVSLQRSLSQREKRVQVYFDCTSTYAELQKERADFDDQAAALVSTDARRKRNRIAFLDLLAAERKFAAAGLLPREIFVEWFGLLHSEIHTERSQIAGLSYMTRWEEDGRLLAGRIFPQFAELMSRALKEPRYDVLKVLVLHSLKARNSLFRRFRR